MKSYQIVAILPPDYMSEGMEQIMLSLNKKYKTSKALEYRPHITLKSMGMVDDEKTQNMEEIIENIAKSTKPFIVTAEGLRSYGTNKNFPGVYVPVKRTKGLVSVHEKLALSLGSFSDKDRGGKELEKFNPHITLVGTDISKACLIRAQKLNPDPVYYRFPVDEINLLTGGACVKPKNFRLCGHVL